MSITQKALLIITDGIGYNSSYEFNAFAHAIKPTYDNLFKHTPYSLVKTYGKYVGLPKGQMGNSEVGHMSIGSGRILYQDLVKINIAIQEYRLQDNIVFKNLLKSSKNIHLIGLLSDGGVHSHIDHIIAMAQIAEKNGNNVFLHLITDGRDVAPDSASPSPRSLVEPSKTTPLWMKNSSVMWPNRVLRILTPPRVPRTQPSLHGATYLPPTARKYSIKSLMGSKPAPKKSLLPSASIRASRLGLCQRPRCAVRRTFASLPTVRLPRVMDSRCHRPRS